MEVNIWIFLLLSALKAIVVTVLLLMCVAYTVLLERKLVGRIQNRWGPSRVGPFGFFSRWWTAPSFSEGRNRPRKRLSSAVYSRAHHLA